MRVLATLLAYLFSLAVVAFVTFFVVWFLAGPHSSVLPSAFATPVLLLGWLIVLCVPIWIAHKVWRRMAKANTGAADPLSDMSQ